MTLKQYLLTMLFGTSVAGVAVWTILAFVNPEEVGPLAAAALLVAVGMTVTGTLTLLGVVVRVFLFRREGLVSRHVRVSFRQAALAAFLVVIAFELSHMELFAWWSIVLAIAAIAIAEYFFLSSEEYGQEELFEEG